MEIFSTNSGQESDGFVKNFSTHSSKIPLSGYESVVFWKKIPRIHLARTPKYINLSKKPLLRDHVNATVINCPIPLTNLNCGNANPEIQTTRTHIWPRDANSNAKRANPDRVNTKFTAKLDTDGFSEKAKRRSLQEHVFIKQISWKTAQNWQKSTNNGSRFYFNNYLMTKTIKME